MKLRLIAVGRLKEKCARALADEYLRRARPLLRRIGLTDIEVRELPEARAATADQRRKLEAAAIMKAIGADARLIVLDERGQERTSREFTQCLQKLSASGARTLAVVIGGPDGVSEELRARADLLLAFGRMTWPHRLARVMLAEQLYRAGTIAAGLPYHRD